MWYVYFKLFVPKYMYIEEYLYYFDQHKNLKSKINEETIIENCWKWKFLFFCNVLHNQKDIKYEHIIGFRFCEWMKL